MINTADLLYMEVDITAFLIVLIVLIKSIGTARTVSQKNFVAGIISEMVFMLTDMGFVLVYRNILPYNGQALFALKSLYMIASAAMAYVFFLYFEKLKGGALLEKKLMLILTAVPLMVLVALIIQNVFVVAIFAVDDQGMFQRRNWFISQFIFDFFYIFLISRRALDFSYKFRNTPDGKTFLIYAFCPMIPGAAGILQYLYPEIPITNIVLALETLLFYMNSMDDLISVDPLTQLYNRRMFMRIMGEWMNVNNEAVPMYFMIMDVDKFKDINDTYGHTEGDRALVRVADSLKESCQKQHRNATISRYGGDEFVILVEADGEDEVNKLIFQINRTLEEKGQAAAAPYPIGLSIGFARLDEARTVKGVIDMADARQYEVKKKHHSIYEQKKAERAAERGGKLDAQ